MNENLIKNWAEVNKIFKNSFLSSFHYSFGTVSKNGTPHITPIGSLILNPKEPKGVYFEIFTGKLKENIERNPNVCVMAVNSSKFFWLKSLMLNNFSTSPGIRLFGKATNRRRATDIEILRWRRRIRPLRITPGYDSLWKNLEYVREIEFEYFETIDLGRTTKRLFQS